MSSTKKPQAVDLTSEEASALKERIDNKSLTDEDYKTFSGLISFSLWLQQQLSLAKISIRRLKSVFNIKTEKKSLQELTSLPKQRIFSKKA